jgi:hypothetical protein
MALGPLGGTSGYMLTTSSGLAAPVVQITTQQAQLMFFAAGNSNGAQRFLRFYDTASVPPLNAQGATSANGMTAAYQFIIPGSTAGAGSNLPLSPGPPIMSGLQFSAGMAVSITSNYAIGDLSGISGVNECFAVIGYR